MVMVLPAEGHVFYDFFGQCTVMLDLAVLIYVEWESGSVFSLYKQIGSVIFGPLANGRLLFIMYFFFIIMFY